jgi:outer membrane protein OmpA-like peptidoglycan-associated protein
LISRYPGATIEECEVTEYNQYTLPLGKLVKRELPENQLLEGKITRITYNLPQGRSTLEVYQNYKTALKEAGFDILFTCAQDACGDFKRVYQYINILERHYLVRGKMPNQRFLTAKLSRPEGDVYVTLFVTLGWKPYVITQLDVVEVKPMEAGLVTVNADALAKDIEKTGHVAIYGIYFDTDKSEVKPESDPVLEEIVNLLNMRPSLRLYVVGHTDNVGKFDYNMTLSQQRADAVVGILTSRYGIPADRLEAHGVGPLSPVASNSTAEGRAQNRRVELVAQ